ncbi:MULTISPECIES: cation-translocating P-type ATPase [Cupriavidus]
MSSSPSTPAAGTPSGATGATPWHARECHEVAREYAVDPARGLDSEQAAQRAREHGPNALQAAPRRSVLALAAAQLADPMVVILVIAAIASAILGDKLDALVILAIVLMTTALGLSQTWRADRALAQLQQLAAAQATVLRDGHPHAIPAHELVPGDVVLLEAGNQVPADLRLVEVAQLMADESALTGESATVAKHAEAIAAPAATLGDRHNMAYLGTSVTQGHGRGIVVATGTGTELGKLARHLAPARPDTPLQKRLAAFSWRLSVAILLLCVAVFWLGLLRGEPPVLMLLTAISLGVAAIPEALPAVVAIILALGARKMATRKALVRKLSSVETLGSVTVICTDKTGTLTQNRMRLERLLADARPWLPGEALANPCQRQLLVAAALCNDARPDPDAGTDISTTWIGDPTETALADAASAAGIDKLALEARLPRVQEQPFDAARKRMTTFHRQAAGYIAFTKGAPESVIPCCTSRQTADGTLPMAPRAALHDALHDAQALAAQGLRVLALAMREHDTLPDPDAVAGAESSLTFLGLVALFDPPRPEAAAAVRDCVTAGIMPVMITGDHPETALAIARMLGILGEHGGEVLTGAALAQLDRAALQAAVAHVRVYARVDPEQKLRIVEALQNLGHFVAMTGDGINDAPALKRADIGVAMGRQGTDIAREAASLVLLDDNFATVVAAVREGRRIYDNIRKFVRYAMTGNSGELWVITLAPLFLLPIPLLPAQILWVNLVTDGLPGLALAAEPAEADVMRRPPRHPRESLFAHGMWQHILGIGLLIGLVSLGVQAWALGQGRDGWQTMVFTTLTLAQMAHVMAIRSEHVPLWRLPLATNLPLLGAVLLTLCLQLAVIYLPVFQALLHTRPLDALELAVSVGAAAIVAVAVEAGKARRNARAARAAQAGGTAAPAH